MAALIAIAVTPLGLPSIPPDWFCLLLLPLDPPCPPSLPGIPPSLLGRFPINQKHAIKRVNLDRQESAQAADAQQQHTQLQLQSHFVLLWGRRFHLPRFAVWVRKVTRRFPAGGIL